MSDNLVGATPLRQENLQRSWESIRVIADALIRSRRIPLADRVELTRCLHVIVADATTLSGLSEDEQEQISTTPGIAQGRQLPNVTEDQVSRTLSRVLVLNQHHHGIGTYDEQTTNDFIRGISRGDASSRKLSARAGLIQNLGLGEFYAKHGAAYESDARDYYRIPQQPATGQERK